MGVSVDITGRVYVKMYLLTQVDCTPDKIDRSVRIFSTTIYFGAGGYD